MHTAHVTASLLREVVLVTVTTVTIGAKVYSRTTENGGLLGNQTAPSKLYLSKLYLLLLLAHHQDWAVGMPNYRIRNASQ
jgi:hypothetical protein